MEDLTHIDPMLGTVAGPRWNNFGVCLPECYVCTFECIDTFGPDRKLTQWVVDLYVVAHAGLEQQSYLLRMDEDWEGSYHSGPIETLFTVSHKPWSQALHVLCSMGRFTWSKQ